MGALLTWLLWAFQYGPAIIKVIMAIINAIRSMQDPKAQADALAGFEQAMTSVKESGDLNDLQGLANRLGVRERIKAQRAQRQERRGRKNGVRK
jgi:hypothetical protein